MPTINIIDKKTPFPKLFKVAAYARVSCAKDAMLHSLSNQVSYFSSLIQSHKGWKYVGVYLDRGITGTKGDRSGFKSLVKDANIVMLGNRVKKLNNVKLWNT